MSQTALWCEPLDLKKNSTLSGDIDDSKLNYVIKRAQLIHVQSYLGTDLYEELQVASKAGTLTAIQAALIEDYIHPMLIYWTLHEYISVAAYTVSNKGILKHSDETADTVTRDEIEHLISRHKATAEHFTNRLIKFLCDNSSQHPSYGTNTGSDTTPSTNSKVGGIFIG